MIGGIASAAAGPGGNRLAARRRDPVRRCGRRAARRRRRGCRVGVPGLPAGRQRVHRHRGARQRHRRARRHADPGAAGGARGHAARGGARAAPHGLHIGIVVDEHQAEFGRGDFLVRSVLGANQADGAITVGDDVDVGQTVQFQVRDADAADEDLGELLAGARAAGALLFACTGRGEQLFGAPTTTPRWSRTCSVRCRSPAGSAPARSARSAGATRSTASPRAWRCSKPDGAPA